MVPKAQLLSLVATSKLQQEFAVKQVIVKILAMLQIKAGGSHKIKKGAQNENELRT